MSPALPPHAGPCTLRGAMELKLLKCDWGMEHLGDQRACVDHPRVDRDPDSLPVAVHRIPSL